MYSNNPLPQGHVMPNINTLTSSSSMIDMASTSNSVNLQSIYGQVLQNDGNNNNNGENAISLVEIYDSEFKYKNEEMESDYERMVKHLDLLDDESMDVIYSYLPGFTNNNKRWMFSFITGMYSEKYKALFDKYKSLFTWVCFNVAFLIIKGEKALSGLSSNFYTGINANSVNIGKRKRLRVGQQINNAILDASLSTDTTTHPLLNSNEYKNWRILFNISDVLNYNIPSDFAPLHATHSRAAQKIQLNGNTSAVYSCIKVDIFPPFITDYVQTKIQSYQFDNFINPGLVEYIEKIYKNELKLSFGMKVGHRKSKDATTNTLIIDNVNSTADPFHYSLIKTITTFIDTQNTKMGPYIASRCYADVDINIPAEIVLPKTDMDAIEHKFPQDEVDRLNKELDEYIRNRDNLHAAAATASVTLESTDEDDDDGDNASKRLKM